MALLASWLAPPGGAFLMTALLLVAAVLGLRLARLTHVPRVVGYLVLGLILRSGLQLALSEPAGFTPPVAEAIGIVEGLKSLALCLILFTIGTAFDTTHLKAIRSHVWKLSLTEIATVFTLVLIGVLLVGRDHGLVGAVFLAVAALETAPAATVLVLREYAAKGPMTDHILAMTGVNNLIAIVAFYVAFLLFAQLGPDSGGLHTEYIEHGLASAILLATIGSAAIGFALGLILSLAHVSLTRLESLLAFLAIMLAVSLGAKSLGLNPLIMAMFMGLAFTHFSIQPHQLMADLEPISGPLFALFFVLAGFQLEPGRLWDIGLVGVAFLAARAAGKILGARLGVLWIGPRHLVPANIGTAMLCQAGVAIGLGKYLLEHWGREVNGQFEPDPGALAVNTVILASVAVFELAGPLAIKRAAINAGEVKLLTLLTRPGTPLREMFTILTRLGHAASPAVAPAPEMQPEQMTARHAMRTNIPSLRDTAKMSEVLRFVEHSRLNDFFAVDAEGHFVGTISFRDLRNLVFNPVLAQMLTAYDMANTAPPLVLADQPLKEVLDLFHKHDVGSMPVIENLESRRLLGVIEQRDVLRALHAGNQEDHEESAH